MGDTTISSTLSGAVIGGDGASPATGISGSWTAVYDASGNLVSVSNVDITVDGQYGSETFNAAVVTSISGTYEIELEGNSTNYTYGSLQDNGYGYTYDTGTPSFLAWTGEQPSSLDSATTLYEGDNQDTPYYLSSDGSISDQTICFLAGTKILTPNGEVAVEALRRGDLVITADGAAEPITWLGKQTIAAGFADPRRAWPVRVKAGALAENVPCRDLLVSPGHALLIDGILVLAAALVNGTSVVRETTVPDMFVYYHVELDGHALVLAENTPAETFIDNVDRLAFDNWAEHEALYPNGKEVAAMPYPVAKSCRQVPAGIRARLAARAGAPERAAA